MTWQDYGDDGDEQDDEPAITLGDLRDGETVTLAFRAEPETFDSDYGEAVRVEATYLDSDYTWSPDDHDGDVTNGDGVVLVTWSKRLVAALAAAHDEGSIVGDAFVIRKSGSGYETDYTVERVDEAAE
jgi:hypothetical protein